MEQLGLITTRVESGLLTDHLIMAHDTFGPMARVDTSLLKAHNFMGPNRAQDIFWPINGSSYLCQTWALGSFGLYWPVNFSVQRWPNLGFSLLKAHGILWPSWLEFYSAC